MESQESVERLLVNYREMRQCLEGLKFQIENFKGLNYDGVIEELTFMTPEGERVQNSSVADKSAKIALTYREIVDQQNEEVLRGMTERYFDIKQHLDTLDHCISLMDQKLSSVITDMFIHKLSWDEMCDKYYVSRNMLSKYRKTGLAQIAKIFQIQQSRIMVD